MSFLEKTDMAGVRLASKVLLDAVDITPGEIEIFVQHPYTNSLFAMDAKGKMLTLTKEEDYQVWHDNICRLIDKSDLAQIFTILINAPWYLTWLKMIKSYLSKEDFSIWLGEAWTQEENPNMDCNVSIAEAIKWFKEADPKTLMEEDEYAYWESLPDEVELWRGVGVGRRKYGLSFTANEETAVWFRDRWKSMGDECSMLYAKVPKKYCLAYFNRRNEDEIVVNVNAIKKYIKEV